MSTVEDSLNVIGAQTLCPALKNEDESSFNQQYYKEQDIDNNFEEISSNSNITELTEDSQSSTQLSTISTFDHTSQFDIDMLLINPISFLNTMHQKLKTSKAPVYSYSHDSVTGHFYCQVDFYDQIYENKNPRPKKQQAKEEAANIAMKDLSLRMPEITNLIRQELMKAHNSLQKANNKNNNQIIKRSFLSRQSYQQIVKPHPLELIPKSIQWLNKQQAQASSTGQTKRPCVLLLEFCQMHKLGHPVYNIRDDGRGYYLFDCTVYNTTFSPTMSFWKKSDAKDHVSNIAFNFLYDEFVKKERLDIQQSYPLAASVNGISSPPPLPPPPPTFPPMIYPNVTNGNNYALQWPHATQY